MKTDSSNKQYQASKTNADNAFIPSEGDENGIESLGAVALSSIDIHTLLPQQEPFVMVGRLAHIDEVLTATMTTIQEDNIFVENGSLSATGLMENIAQTCAARIGYVNKYILKRGIQIGYIGAIRQLQIFHLPKVGQTICTNVAVDEEVFGMTLAHATITCGTDVVATCEMKIAVKEEA